MFLFDIFLFALSSTGWAICPEKRPRKRYMGLYVSLYVPVGISASQHPQPTFLSIIGGGAAGLTFANRLSEDPTRSILVLEAGNDHINDTGVQAPGAFGSLYGDPRYDWDYDNVPQSELNSRVHRNIAGKGLGGGAAVNFMWWTHTNQRNIDDWGLLGNEGWSWAELQPYLRKSEAFSGPSAQTEVDLETSWVDTTLHGTKGPIKNGIPSVYGPLQEAWPRTFETLGLSVTEDPRGGNATGGYQNTFNIDPRTKSRSYPASAYHESAAGRSNLLVTTGAFVTKILLNDTSTPVRATGVTYIHENKTKTATAAKEVILSAGGTQSPHLLELSGIGNCTLLSQFDIPCVVDNANVGENLQNHMQLPLGWPVNRDLVNATADDLAAPEAFQAALAQYERDQTGPLGTVNGSSALLSLAQISGDVTQIQDLLTTYYANCTSSASILPPLAAQHALLLSSILAGDPVGQEISIAGGIQPWFFNESSRVFASPGLGLGLHPNTSHGGGFFTIIGLVQHPFSRGSTHIQSTDPKVQPAIDPQYLTHPVDMALSKLLLLHMQNVARTPPLRGLLRGAGREVQEGYYELDEGNVEGYVRERALIAYHHSGTCSMLPRGRGGVVDSRLRVYGVEGLRVVDASVFPLMPQGTVNSVVVGVAERAVGFVRDG